MQSNIFYMEYCCHNEYKYDLTGKEAVNSIFERLWNISTSFAVVNPFAPCPVDLVLGNKKKKKLQLAFDAFPILKKTATEAICASEWPGTKTSSGNRLLVFGKSKDVLFNEFFCDTKNIYWTASGGWEDLMLFDKSKLVFYTCSHEKFGAIIGNSSLFNKLQLSCSDNKYDNRFIIQGYRVDLKTLLE